LHDRDLHGVSARFGPALLDRPRALKAQRVAELSARLDRAALRAGERAATGARLPQLSARMEAAFARRLKVAGDRLEQVDKLRLSLCPNRPLELGFARVHRADGSLARSGAELEAGESVRLVFNKDDRSAVVDGAPSPPAAPSRRSAPRRPRAPHQRARPSSSR
jgi:exodeoxyribonuclease VII large subunit